jgi:hypothetical protein
MAYLAFAVSINTRAGQSVNFLDAIHREGAAVPDRASVAGLAFQQIDLQADVFNTSPVVVSSTPGGPGITLGPGGVGRLTLGPFGSSPLKLGDLYGSGLGVVRITGVTGAIGVDPLAAALPEPHHATHEPGGSDALVHAAWTDQVNTFTQRQILDARLDVNNLAALTLLQVAGLTDLEGALVVRGDAGLQQGLTVVGTATLQSDLDVTGDVVGAGAVAARGGVASIGNQSVLLLQDAAGVVDSRTWRFLQSGGDLFLEALTDASVVKTQAIQVESTFGGVTFPVRYTTHSGGVYCPLTSSNPLLLDHYEEGTWIPTLVSLAGGAGSGYTTQDGTYTRLGNLVFVTFFVEIQAATWSTGDILLAGLPYVNEPGSYGVGKLDYWVITGNVIDVKLHFQPSAAQAYLVYKNAASALGHDGPIDTTYVTPGTSFRGSMTYRTNT